MRTISKKTSKFSAKKKTKKTKTQVVVFEFSVSAAEKVAVIGSFNAWNETANPLKKKRPGKWSLELELPQGRHEYRYFVDGAWHNDQRSVECVPNAFGTWNCIVTVD